MLGLVADDLTGAADASVQFAKRGWAVFLSLNKEYVVSGFSRTRTPASTVLAVTTDSRALSNAIAETRTSNAVTAQIEAGVDRVFLKIDSTMRGSVSGQVAGALAAWRTRYPDARAIVCPAYPAMGRTVESNRLLVQGEPVERTAFGRDPVTPVTTSDMAALLPASSHISVTDAVTDADLLRIAASIADDGPQTIAVGSGGLAGALSQVWTPRVHLLDRRSLGEGGQADRHVLPRKKHPRILLQVSSLNPVSHAQVTRLKRAFPEVVVLVAPPERTDSKVVAANLARQFVELLDGEQWDMLGLIGGDGARETLARLGASGIRIIDSLIEGIPLGIVVGGVADGTPVFTKAGGFGAEDALVHCVERMSE